MTRPPFRHIARRPPARPAAASSATDSESAEDGAGTDRDLFALKVMRDRGLIPAELYERRRAEILGASRSE